MSAKNTAEGQAFYKDGDASVRSWFWRQWKIWPERAHEKQTTNISFHYGGVLSFREAHGRDPVMSQDFRSHVVWHDRQAAREKAA